MIIIAEIWRSLLSGLQTTLSIFLIVSIVSIPLGFLIACARVFAGKWIGAIIQVYIYIMRGSPLLLQLMFIFFGLPTVGIVLDRFTAAILAFILNYAAYYAEIFRGGIMSIPQGQFESIAVLGIGKLRGFRRIIIPQVLKTVLPSVGNEVISLVKDTSLVYVLGIGELLRAGQIAANAKASLIPFVAVGILYLSLTAIVTLILNWTEKKVVY